MAEAAQEATRKEDEGVSDVLGNVLFIWVVK